MVLWVAVAFSLSVYAYRIWRRMTQGPKAARAESARAPATPDSAVEPRLSAAAPASSPIAPASSPIAPTAPATPPPMTAGTPAPRPARVPVAELVSGIQMPCELAPLLADGGLPDPFEVTFVTTSADADQVGAALDHELQRLGFEVTRLSNTKTVATKDARELTVTVVPNAADAAEGKRRRYPTAPPGSVAVELRT
jgi:hypothetical protein